MKDTPSEKANGDATPRRFFLPRALGFLSAMSGVLHGEEKLPEDLRKRLLEIITDPQCPIVWPPKADERSGLYNAETLNQFSANANTLGMQLATACTTSESSKHVQPDPINTRLSVQHMHPPWKLALVLQNRMRPHEAQLVLEFDTKEGTIGTLKGKTDLGKIPNFHTYLEMLLLSLGADDKLARILPHEISMKVSSPKQKDGKKRILRELRGDIEIGTVIVDDEGKIESSATPHLETIQKRIQRRIRD